MNAPARALLVLSSVLAMVSLPAGPVAAVDDSVRISGIVDASEAAAASGVDVIATSTPNRTGLVSRLTDPVAGGVAVRDHLVVGADNAFYHSIRKSRGRQLLGSLGANSVQGNWATPSTMYRDARSRSLVEAGLVTPTTAIIGLDAQWPYSYFTPQSAADEGTNFPWYLAQQLLLPYNLANGLAPISNFRERPTSGGSSIITGRVEAGADPDTDFCRATNLTIRVDARDRIRESRWTRDCPRPGGGRLLTKIVAKASYGPQDPKPATSPSVTQSALIGGS